MVQATMIERAQTTFEKLCEPISAFLAIFRDDGSPSRRVFIGCIWPFRLGNILHQAMKDRAYPVH